MKIKYQRKQSGQIALIFLLISAVLMTLGLSVSRKETMETKINISEEKQKEAFNTAEGGINYYLGTGELSYQSGSNKALVESSPIGSNQVGSTHVINFDEYILENNPTYFWLVGHDSVTDAIKYTDFYSGTSLTICNNGVSVSAKIDYFYKTSLGEIKVNHNYSLFDVGCNKTVAVGTDTTPLLLVITPIGAGTRFSIEGSSVFPKQGRDITSTGMSGEESEAEKVKSRVRVTEKYEIPTFMLDTLVAGINIGY